jgi:NAD(P)-dependent dehydrogenase (short-subunit alcohol dehydrogenase family)
LRHFRSCDSGLIYAIEKANAVADAINAVEPGRALAVVGDILDASYVETLVKRTAEFGGGKIHIIVNNAGFTWDGVIHKVSLWTDTILYTLCCTEGPRYIQYVDWGYMLLIYMKMC